MVEVETIPKRIYNCGCTLGDERRECFDMEALQMRMQSALSETERIEYFAERHTAAEHMDALDEERAVRRLVRDHLRDQEHKGLYSDG